MDKPDSLKVEALHACLGIWGVSMIVAGKTFTWPGLPARKWIETVLYQDSIRLLPDEDQGSMYDLIYEQKVDPKKIYRHTLSTVSGREWYVAERLVGIMLDDHIRGEIMLCLDLDRTPFAAVLDAVYAVSSRWADDKKRKKLDGFVYGPPMTDPLDRRRDAQRSRELARAAGQPVASGRPSGWTPPKTGRRHRHRPAGNPQFAPTE